MFQTPVHYQKLIFQELNNVKGCSKANIAHIQYQTLGCACFKWSCF